MSHPGDEIQKAVFAALNGNAGLDTAMGGTTRIYDRVPSKPVFPYITIGEEQLLDDGNSCDASRFEIFIDVHVWTDNVGLPQGKRIAAAVFDAMQAGLLITGWRVVVLKYETERHFRDSDGLRGHAVLTFKLNIETS
jgi:hypothetical protein